MAVVEEVLAVVVVVMEVLAVVVVVDVGGKREEGG